MLKLRVVRQIASCRHQTAQSIPKSGSETRKVPVKKTTLSWKGLPALGLFLLLCTVTAHAAVPVANFSVAPLTGTVPLNVSFTDTSANSPTGWAWYFGDELYNQSWTQVTPAAAWSQRSTHTSVVLPNGSIILMGGANSTAYFNDTWRSFDSGATWTPMNESSGWSQRGGHSSVMMPDSSIILMGGADSTGYFNDTWRSFDSGATWTLMNASSGWSARGYAGSVVMPDGSIILMGGASGDGYLNDTWRSFDSGATWTPMNASSGWESRFGLSSVVMPDNTIVLTGGQGDSAILNDTWHSTNSGASWTRINASGTWNARHFHTSTAMPDGTIILMGGTDGTVYYNDMWRSSDNGITWTGITPDDIWTARAGSSTIVMPDGSVVLFGGYTTSHVNDVWRFQPAGSSLQNALHKYTSAGNYSVALQAYNADGYNATRKIQYITVTDGIATGPVHNINTGLNYTTIAAAVSNASSGNTILVDSGLYRESVKVNASITLRGNDTGSGDPLIDAMQGDSALWIAATSVTVDRFRVTNTTFNTTDWRGGGVAVMADSALVTNITAYNNSAPGIFMSTVRYTTVADSSAYNNTWCGFNGYFANYSTIRNVTSYSNGGSGITFSYSTGNFISSSTVHDNNDYGVDLYNSTGSTVTNSSILQNTAGGIDLDGASGNTIFDNYFNNTHNILNATLANTWNTTKTSGTSIHGGPYIGGNLWSNYNGTDTDGDGIGNTFIPYTDEGNILTGGDWLPLTNVTVTAPVASFTANTTWGNAPLTVQFNDTSTNTPTSWNWSFGDGIFSSVQNTTHTYSTPGTYTVNLTAVNAGGSNLTVKTDYLTVTVPHPTAAFSANSTSGTAPLVVSFTDSSTNTPTGWAWFFGDETYTQPWNEMTPGAPWPARHFHNSVVLQDGSILLMAGDDWFGTVYNDIWRSTDNGTTWSQVTSGAAWSGRSDAALTSMPDGSLVIMGGYDGGGGTSDVWRSTNQGISWTLVNNSPGWTARFSHRSVALPDGSIVLAGGMDSALTFYNDTWRSVDNGLTWTEIDASAGWSARAAPSIVVMYDGSIVLMGGHLSGYTDDPVNDVWRSTDQGDTWILMNASAGWSPRYAQTQVVMPDDSIILMGGTPDGSIVYNDVWRSEDYGATWAEIDTSADWSPRLGSSSVAMPDGSIVVTGGRDTSGVKSDAWQFSPTGSFLQNPVHTYTTAGNYTIALQASNTGGFNSTRITGYINVTSGATAPVASFTSNVTWGNAPLTVQFTDTSSNTPTAWNWSFGDTTYSELQNPSHIYNTPGTYTINLTATNAGGSNLTVKADFLTVTVPHPTAAFSANSTSGTAPLTVQFSDSSANSPTGWAWFLGDETYSQPWIQMSASAGWPARYAASTAVLPDGTIILTGGMDSGYNQLNDTWRSADNGATWTLMNASSGWTQRDIHSSVALSDGSILIMGGNAVEGLKNDVWRSTDFGATWTLVNASAGWDPRDFLSSTAMPDGSIILTGGYDGGFNRNDVWRSTDNGLTWIQMNASAEWQERSGHSTVPMPDGSIVMTGGSVRNDTWRSTDNGVTWTEMNASAGWPARYRHGSAVMADGSILIMGGEVGASTYTNDVWRSSDNGAFWTRVNASAGWTARDLTGSVVMAMPDGSIALIGGYDGGFTNDTWRFQPAGSSLQNPVHTYTSVGNYTIALQASNTGGYDVSNQVTFINVTSSVTAPVASFSGSNYNGKAPLEVQFNDTSTNTPTAWNWSFGDGAFSTMQNTTHTYTAIGLFNVSLTASNAGGSDTVLELNYTQVSDVTANFTWACNATVPYQVDFQDTSTTSFPPIESHFWDFGDGNSTVLVANPSNVYPNASIAYSVRLQVWDSLGGGGVDNATVINVTPCSVGTPPVASFTSDITSGTAPLDVQFNDTSANAPTAWKWSFQNVTGNNTAVWWSTDRNATHTFGTGNYRIRLNASNSAGFNISTQVTFVNVTTAVPPANATTINQSATLFIGEEGLNLTHALNQAAGATDINGIPTLTTIGWWSSPSFVGVSAPDYTVALNTRYRSMLIDQDTFVGRTGYWYLLDGGMNPLTPAIFTITDPSLDIRIWDLDHATDVTGSSITQGTRLGFRIDTNMDQVVGNRSPLNPATDGFIDISVKNESGITLTTLYNDSTSAGAARAGPHSILANYVNAQPFYWGSLSGYSWASGALNDSNPIYPPGTYTVTATSTLHNMLDNYRTTSGAAYTGKTISLTRSLTISSPPAPVVSFTADTTNGTVPFAVHFTDTSDGSPIAWNWSFGDGNYSAVQNPTYTFVLPKVHNVTLTAKFSSILSNNTMQQVTGYATKVSTTSAVNGTTSSTVAGNQTMIVNTSAITDTGGTVTTSGNTITITGGNTFWQSTQIQAASIATNETPGNVTVANVTQVVMLSTPVTTNLNQTFSNVSVSLDIALKQYIPDADVNITITQGATTDTTHAFQLAAQNASRSISDIAFTVQFTNTELINTNLTQNITRSSNAVVLNMSVNHTWVARFDTGSNNNGRDAIAIIRYPETGDPKSLPTRFIAYDSAADIDWFNADSEDGLSIFGMVGYAAQQAATQQNRPSGSIVQSTPEAQETASQNDVVPEKTISNPTATSTSAPTNPPSIPAYMTTAPLKTDTSGQLTSQVQVKSADQAALITLPKGIKPTDSEGHTITSVSIAQVDTASVPSPESSDFTFSGIAYECGPDGAQFTPVIAITLSLTESQWARLTETGIHPVIRTYSSASGTWESLPTSTDTGSKTLSAPVSHFSTYAVFSESTTDSSQGTTPSGSDLPAASPTSAGTAKPPSNALEIMVSLASWCIDLFMKNLFLAIGAIAALILGFVGWSRYRRKRRYDFYVYGKR